MADSGNGLLVIDISDPENPQIVGSVDTPGLAVDVCISGNLALIADTSGDLQIIRISNPERPQILSSVSTPGDALSVSFFGTHAYVAMSNGVENNNDTRQLQVIDVSNPMRPQIEGVVGTQYPAGGVFVTEDYVCVTTTYGVGGLEIFPTQCWSLTNVEEPLGGSSPMHLQTYPNPGSTETYLQFQRRHSGPVQVNVYDIAGRLIRQISNSSLAAGNHQLIWDGRSDEGRAVATGVYLIRVSSAEGEATSRVVMVR